jgi:hypothetical protein
VLVEHRAVHFACIVIAVTIPASSWYAHTSLSRKQSVGCALQSTCSAIIKARRQRSVYRISTTLSHDCAFNSIVADGGAVQLFLCGKV